MRKINQLLKKYELKPRRYEKNGKVTYIDTSEGKFVLKENKHNQDIYNYLDSRSFDYYPKRLNSIHDDYEITEYIEEITIPREQKIIDLIDLTTLLHNKTTHYKEVDIADDKQLYEDINNNIAYLNSYYSDLITLIETKVYMSPSEYLLARNISKVFAAIAFAKPQVEEWYELVKDKKKKRYVILHNNLKLDHFLENKNSYFINWDKAKIDIPVFDLYKLYRHHCLDFDFDEILKRYESSYPLLEDERKLFFILISLPDIIKFDDSEYNMTKKISQEMDKIYKTEMLLTPYFNNKESHN
ncbi:MAG: hypothetical protein PHO63_03190 [Bacilli bacterium]|nr:hypothetical protein [Bacilli bacterium]MDD4808592.1 hypothetical protein [Bacilli bacterium]